MALLSSTFHFEFDEGMEQLVIVETASSATLYLLTIVSTRQRWKWKEDRTRLEFDVVQFSGSSSAEVRKQCDEWLWIHFQKNLQMILQSSVRSPLPIL